MFDRFTDRAKHSVVLAQKQAHSLNHAYIGTEHLLLGLLDEKEGIAAQVLAEKGITLDKARDQVIDMIGMGDSPDAKHLPFTSNAKKVLDGSLREALQLGQTYIGTEHLLLALVKVVSKVDEVVAALKESRNAEEARERLKAMLSIDDGQADGILSMQLRQLASLEREKIVSDHDRLTSEIEECDAILSDPRKRVEILEKELAEIVDKFGDDRRTQIVRDPSKVEDEDLIEDKAMVYSLTRSGYIKATSKDEYKSQHRGGKGIKGASLAEGDLVDHFLLASNHDWLLFFTNLGRLYKIKGFEVPESKRDSKGQHIANVLQLEPGEKVEQMLSISNFDEASFLVLATKSGKVKKTPLSMYANSRKRGLIAISLAPGDEVIGAALCNEDDELIFISKKGMSIRFKADNDQLRPLGRQAAGVQAMKLRKGDEVISMEVVPQEDSQSKGKYLLLATSQGFAKKTPLDRYKVQQRNGYGTKAMSMKNERGSIVGAVIVGESEDIFMPVLNSGKVIRFNSAEVKDSGRVTQGVKAVTLDEGDEVTGAFKSEAPQEDLGVC